MTSVTLPLVGLRREDFRVGLVIVGADELGGSARVQRDFGRCEIVLARRTSALALLLHQAIEPCNIYFNSAIAQNVLREIEWKSICIIQLEGHITDEDARPSGWRLR